MTRIIGKLAVAAVVLCTTGCGDHASPEDQAEDRAAAEAIVESLMEGYAAIVGRERPGRMALGGWDRISAEGGAWADRLAPAIREVTLETDTFPSEATWLFDIDFERSNDGTARIVASVLDEDEDHCCVEVAVDVWPDGDGWAIGEVYHAGWINVDPRRLMHFVEEIKERETVTQIEMTQWRPAK